MGSPSVVGSGGGGYFTVIIILTCSMSDAGGMVMSPIKVIVKQVESPTRPPTPDESFGDTMFVIDLMRQEREKQDRLVKDQKILRMALEQKKKKEEESHCKCWRL